MVGTLTSLFDQADVSLGVALPLCLLLSPHHDHGVGQALGNGAPFVSNPRARKIFAMSATG